MFNFNTNKRNAEPSMNTAMRTNGSGNMPSRQGGQAANINAVPQNGMQNGMDFEQQAFIRARAEELENQRRDFMRKRPDFDLETEMQNPEFAKYVLAMGLSIEDAFYLVHKDEIIQEEIQAALNRLAARRERISENGAGKNSPAVVKKNPKDMSDKEIDAIIERVRNGEKISF